MGGRGGEEERDAQRRKQDARAPETRVHIAVACRSYLIQSWIMLRQDAARIYDLGKKRVLTPDTQADTRATASVSVDGETRDDVCINEPRRDVRFANKDNDMFV